MGSDCVRSDSGKIGSRTSNSIKNAWVNVLYFIIQILLGFWSRKVFYDYLGAEVLGLDTTAQSLMSFLNIAESGVGMAVAYFLYTPFYRHDYQTINKIVALQGWIYRRIGALILVLSIVLMCFFPLIFDGIQIPLWYAYIAFFVVLVGNLLGYYANYRQCILSADQKTYKVTKVYQSSAIFFKILLIIWLPSASNPFVLYASTTFLGHVIGAVWLNRVIKKEYPWVRKVEEKGVVLLHEFPEVIQKTKQLFIHKVAGFAVFCCAPIIMYSFSSLTAIAFYGNYLVVTGKVGELLTHVFSSTSASVGNLIASGDKDRMISVFWELNDSRMCISSIFIFFLFVVTEPFIALWLSPTYLLGRDLLLLVLINLWLSVNRSTIDSFKDGFSIFQDVWAPLVESIINIGVAVMGGYLWGMKGVLFGGITSSLIILYGWKPYYLFRKGFELDCLKQYFIPYAERILILIIMGIVLYEVYIKLDLSFDSYLQIVLYGVIAFCLISIGLFVPFYFFTVGMRHFCQRLQEIILSK